MSLEFDPLLISLAHSPAELGKIRDFSPGISVVIRVGEGLRSDRSDSATGWREKRRSGLWLERARA